MFTFVILSDKPLSLPALTCGALGAIGPNVSITIERVTDEVVPPVVVWTAVTSKLCASPASVLRFADVKAAVVQVPLAAAVTGPKLTEAPVIWFFRVTTTVAPLWAKPEIVGNSLALMMLSTAILALREIGVDGTKLLSSVTVVAALIDELTLLQVCLAVT